MFLSFLILFIFLVHMEGMNYVDFYFVSPFCEDFNTNYIYFDVYENKQFFIIHFNNKTTQKLYAS